MKKRVISFLTAVVLVLFAAPFVRASASEGEKNILLIHGGWHGEWSWYKTAGELEQRGYNVYTLDLPSHGSDTTSVWQASINSYVNAIEQKLDEIDGSVIVVGHGSSSAIVSAVTEKRPEKVSQIIYIGGVLVDDNESIAEVLLNPSNLSAMGMRNASFKITKNMVYIKDKAVPQAVYNGLSDEDLKIGVSNIGGEPITPLFCRIKLGDNYFSTPKYYIKTVNDNCLNYSYQNKLTQKVKCNDVFVINSGHVPFISDYIEVCDIIDDVASRTDNGILPVRARSYQEKDYSELDVEAIEEATIAEFDNVEEVSFEEFANAYFENESIAIQELENAGNN